MNNYLRNSSSIERREKPRMECAYAAMVRGLSSKGKKFEENAIVSNLSSSGLYLSLNRSIQKGQEISVKIAFPTNSLELGTSKLYSNGVVVRTEALSEGVLGVAITFQSYRFA